VKTALKNVGCFTHSRYLTTLSINHTACSRKRTTKRNTVHLSGTLSLREDIPEIIGAFKTALKLKSALKKNTAIVNKTCRRTRGFKATTEFAAGYVTCA
jgi:hypothetical protein